MNILNKKAMSAIVTTVIMVALSLVAIGIVWVVIENILSENVEEISLKEQQIDLELSNVLINEENIEILVKRNSGKGNLKGGSFLFEDSNGNSSIVKKEFYINELESKKIIISLSEIGLEEIIKINILPIIGDETTSFDKSVSIEVTDEYEFSKKDLEDINNRGDSEDGDNENGNGDDEEDDSKELPSIIFNGEELYIYFEDSSTNVEWSPNGVYNVTEAQSETNGFANTKTIVDFYETEENYAAGICENLNSEGYDDWYLPAKEELRAIAQWHFENNISKGDYSEEWSNFSGPYWSSTESSDSPNEKAWRQGFFRNYKEFNFKYSSFNVRCVRSNNSEDSDLLYSLSEDLVGYWGFEGNADDESGNENNGELYGDINCNVDGKIGKACLFDGEGDYVDINDPYLNSTSFTISLWFNSEDVEDGGRIFGYGNYYGANWPKNLECYFNHGTNSVFRCGGVYIKEDGTLGNIDVTYENDFAENGEWNQLTLIWNREKNNTKLYVNSDLKVNKDYYNLSVSPNLFGDFNIGRRPLGQDKYFKGLIDEVRIYNKTLTQDEIDSLYEQGD